MFGLNDDQALRLVYLTVLLVIVLGSVGLGRSRGAGKFRHLGVWILIGSALVIVYVYRAPVLDFAAPVLRGIAPSRVVEVTNPEGERELVVGRADDGHFHVNAEANGVRVRFLIDTGASTTVLSLSDARRVGIDVDALAFNRPVQTANGVTYFASAWLDSLTIGSTRLASVPVGVMPDDALDTSLLGMTTINRFSSWRVEGDKMVLSP
jgi:aspartyl protease family protein